MAIYKLFPTKDATLYSAYQSMNTGLDSVIEATTDFKIGSPNQEEGDDPQASRFLVQFDLDEILNTIDVIASGSTTTSFLRIYSANARGLSSTTTLLVNAVGQNWNMGTGEYLLDPLVKDGCCWANTLSDGVGTWTTNTPTSGITGSFNIPANDGGGAWYTSSALYPQISQSFDFYSSLDLNVNVTQLVSNWSSSFLGTPTIPINTFVNYGFIVRQSESQEFVNDLNQQTELKFFSRDTNTIYPPQLEIKWDDSVFNTGSNNNTILDTNEALIAIPNNKNEYYPEEIAKFKINAIEKFPARTYLTASSYTSNFYLPSASSLYAIKDSKTNEYVIDFDSQFTKISADEESSFFKVYMNGLEPERYYTVLIQTNIDGETKIFDQDLNFKVIEG
jgi:hypothetical protein